MTAKTDVPQPTTPVVLTILEVAGVLKVSRRHVAGLVGDGRIASIKIGKKTVRIPRSELERVLREGVA